MRHLTISRLIARPPAAKPRSVAKVATAPNSRALPSSPGIRSRRPSRTGKGTASRVSSGTPVLRPSHRTRSAAAKAAFVNLNGGCGGYFSTPRSGRSLGAPYCRLSLRYRARSGLVKTSSPWPTASRGPIDRSFNRSGTVALALDNAITQVSPSNPAAIGGQVMRVTFEICGVIANNVAGSFTNISMRFADVAITAAPSFGATLVGAIKLNRCSRRECKPSIWNWACRYGINAGAYLLV
jgi:hypothetical protein